MSDSRIIINSNRSRSAFKSGVDSLSLPLEGDIEPVHLSGVVLLAVPDELRNICVPSIYNDEVGGSIPLTKAIIELSFSAEWPGGGRTETMTVQKVIFATNELTFVDVPFDLILNSGSGEPMPSPIVSVKVTRFVDECGNNLLQPDTSTISLTAEWNKAPTNVCTPCLLPQNLKKK